MTNPCSLVCHSGHCGFTMPKAHWSGHHFSAGEGSLIISRRILWSLLKIKNLDLERVSGQNYKQGKKSTNFQGQKSHGGWKKVYLRNWNDDAFKTCLLLFSDDSVEFLVLDTLQMMFSTLNKVLPTADSRISSCYLFICFYFRRVKKPKKTMTCRLLKTFLQALSTFVLPILHILSHLQSRLDKQSWSTVVTHSNIVCWI